MGKFIIIEVLSGKNVIINTDKIDSISAVLSDHTGEITEYNEIRLDNGSKWYTYLTIDSLNKALNNLS